MIRTAAAIWNGSGKEGNGHVTTQSNVLSNTLIKAGLRMESELILFALSFLSKLPMSLR